MSRDPNCIFCKILDKKIPATILYEDELVCAFADLNPQAPHHYLIIPKQHLSDIHSMTKEDTPLIGQLFLAAQKIATQNNLDASGYRLVINNGESAGQTVFHLHLHMLSGRRFSWPPG